ncbi:MAG: sigma-70 family RNA polymerase sigma factor [Deltaproteobacteria bacterium]|nr:sigma-70 family RNA polymerase sigma factor [Deltaproteobacteria bacterium]
MAEQGFTDPELVARVAVGDRGAMAALYDRHAPTLIAVGARVLGSPRDAEDLAHDVFLEAVRHASEFDASRGSVRTWLLVRLRSRALDRRGRAAVMSEQLAREPRSEAPAEPPGSAMDTALRIAVREALGRLPPEVVQVLELTYFAGATARELSGALSLPEGTVRSRLARGLAALREVLGDDADGAP